MARTASSCLLRARPCRSCRAAQPSDTCVLIPRQGLGALWVERRVVVAFADHIAIALTYTGHNAAGRSTPQSTKETNQ